MEQNVPVLAKRFWQMIRVAMYMLRKGISKSKLLTDLNLMMKRGKIAGKAIHNLMFHHHSHHIHEYEFSCNNTPAHTNFLHLPFHLKKRKMHMFSSGAQPSMVVEDGSVTPEVVMKALEMLKSQTASPALPGFGRSPMVRQLRITDSPFPLNYGEEGNHVDEAAEDFIKKFYMELRNQNNAIVE